MPGKKRPSKKPAENDASTLEAAAVDPPINTGAVGTDDKSLKDKSKSKTKTKTKGKK